jgi:hypothetical protein
MLQLARSNGMTQANRMTRIYERLAAFGVDRKYIDLILAQPRSLLVSA